MGYSVAEKIIADHLVGDPDRAFLPHRLFYIVSNKYPSLNSLRPPLLKMSLLP